MLQCRRVLKSLNLNMQKRASSYLGDAVDRVRWVGLHGLSAEGEPALLAA
jgi:hypothetical protein